MKLISRVMVVSCGLVVLVMLLAVIVTSPTLIVGPLTLTPAGLNDYGKRNTGNDAENAEHQAGNIGVQPRSIEVQARNTNTHAEHTGFSLKPPTIMLETLRISHKTPKTTPKTPVITQNKTDTHTRIAPRKPDDATLDPLTGVPSVSHEAVPLRRFYEHIPCLKVTSRAPCTFPLLVDHFQRCGYFAETTSWREAKRGYPKATMRAELCQVPSVASGAQSLARFIGERNISGIVTVGDSQASRMNKALIEELFRRASFNCTLMKKEPRGKQISLEYYTQDSGFETRATAGRICRTCDSALHVCVAPSGEKVRVEYLSMDMGARKPIHLNGSECVKNPKHPLCQDITQQEYVFRHYLKQNGVYPELVMVFSVFAHTVFTPIREAFGAIQDKVKLITDAVPETSHIIWFGGTPYNVMKETNEPKTPEGIGLPVNKKMQVLNHFHASVLRTHMEGNGRPVYPFFDLYNMQAQPGGSTEGSVETGREPFPARVVPVCYGVHRCHA